MRAKRIAEMKQEKKERKKWQKKKARLVEKVVAPIRVSTREFECYMCKTVFESRQSLRKHMVAHERNKSCMICGTFCTESELRQHFCDRNDKQITCEYCGMVFTSIIDILEHVEAHDTVKRYYKCSRCPKIYAMQRFTALHEAHHMDIINFVCKICSKVMLTSGAFKRHMRHHVKRASAEGASLCDECGKSFTTARNLLQHKQTHGEPAFSCPQCPRRFFSQSNLSRHSRTHSDQTFMCGLCNAELSSVKGLKDHMGKKAE